MTIYDWQPIETAPPDEGILVFSRKWGAIIAEFSSEFDQWLPRMQCPASLTGEEQDLTHWMPLPQSPEEAPQPAIVSQPQIVAH